MTYRGDRANILCRGTLASESPLGVNLFLFLYYSEHIMKTHLKSDLGFLLARRFL